MDIIKKILELKQKTTTVLTQNKNVKLLIVVMFLFIITGLVSSKITSYVTLSQTSEDELTKATQDLTTCQADLSQITDKKEAIQQSLDTYKDVNDRLSSQVNDCTESIKSRDTLLTQCQNDMFNVRSNATDTSITLQTTKNALDTCNTNVQNAQNTYNILIQRYANYYCCLQQVTLKNPNLKYYEVINDDIVCLTTGTKEVNCTA